MEFNKKSVKQGPERVTLSYSFKGNVNFGVLSNVLQLKTVIDWSKPGDINDDLNMR